MTDEYRVEPAGDVQDAVKFLEGHIIEYNFATTNRFDGIDFCQVVRNPAGSIIAGISGWTWAGSCEITWLWVSGELRGRGIGTALLLAAEEEARVKECSVILVRSYSFQAPEFYRRHGFTVDHVVDNFPEGFQYFTLTKKIAGKHLR